MIGVRPVASWMRAVHDAMFASMVALL